MSVQAAAGKAIGSPQDFQRFVEFGKHKLPIDTATSWSVFPASAEPRRQIFQVKVWLDTLREGNAVDYTEFEFQADTLAKASGLIQRLRECNVRWHSWLVRIEPSFERRAIRLEFEGGVAGALVKNDLSILDLRARDIFKIFGRIAGAPLQDCQIVDAEQDSVDLVFGEGASEEVLTGRMNQTLESLQVLFLETEPFRELAAKNDPRFKVREDLLLHEPEPVEEEAQGGLDEEPLPLANIEMDPLNPPYFTVTEEAVVAHNRFVGKGKCPWTAEDIPFLIANNRRAPGKKDRDEEDRKEAPEGDQQRADSPAAASGQSDKPFDANDLAAVAPTAASSDGNSAPAAPAPAPIQLRREEVEVVSSKCCC